MKGLSDEIRSALDTIIIGLGYDFSVTDEDGTIVDYINQLEPDKMKKIMDSKISSFNSAKRLLERWINSPNSPSRDVLVNYIEQLIVSGQDAIAVLRSALSQDIDFDKLKPEKHNSAINAKPIILEAIFNLDGSIGELKKKLESKDLTLSDSEFKIGYPEKFARGDFYPVENYYKDWYDEKNDSVRICPFSSNGKKITISDLNITLPKPPKDKSKILFSDLPKKEQYWRRLPVPRGLNPDNARDYEEYILEEFRRRREGVWFMNNGEPVYLTGNHYFALQWMKMLDTGGYMAFRYAQLEMYYHLEAVIVDERSLGQLFVKSRRTGFTYVIISILLNHSTSTRNNNFGMTSKSDTDAMKAFFKYRYALLNLPFFFVPMIKGKLDSPSQFEFTAPISNTKDSKKSKYVNKDEFLNNMIDYEPTKNDSYDGQALYMYLGDECYAPDTKILTEGMIFKSIKDINIGDKIINGQGVLKTVVKKTSGVTDMYKVVQPYGKDYIVTKNHRLLFEYGSSINRTKDIIITPDEYLRYNDNQKRLVRRKVFEGLDFENREFMIDPYVFGAWIGDGYSKVTQFVFNHNADFELLNHLKKYFDETGFDFHLIEDNFNWQKWYISDKDYNYNRFKKELVRLNVWGNKRLPSEYMLSSTEQRLELLAGIIDTDGHLSSKNRYDIAMSRKDLIYDIYNLSKSLGLDTSEVSVKVTNYNTMAYKVSITDYDNIIPCKIYRKKGFKRKTLKRRSRIKDIKPIGLGKYVGIQVDGETDSERTLVLSDYTLSLNSGKWKKPNDYIKHFGQIAPTMLEGGQVVGKAFIGSTVGAMNKGGSQFKDMLDSSKVSERNETTQMTTSGLYSHFLPAQKNMSAFTDIYGVCHTTKPEKKTYNVKGKLIRTGSIEYLISQEEAKRKISDNSLNEQYRAFPRTLEHAFRDEATESVFNITKIYEQMEYNLNIPENQRYIIGNFAWENGIKDTRAVFHPNPKGRFKVAWMPSKADNTEKLANNYINKNGKFYPLNKNVVRIGVDPFSLKSTHGKGSKGSAHGLTVMFPEGGAPSNKFVFEYIARPSDETIFFEDMILAMVYYGAPALIESNRIDLLRYMRNRGYRGFAMNRLDRPYSKLNPNELEYGGQVMSGKDMLDSHMNTLGAWIEKYVGVYNNDKENIRPIGEMGDMPFNETLSDWLHFDPAKRTDYDATISGGLAVMACQVEKYKGRRKQKSKSVNVSELFPKFKNR